MIALVVLLIVLSATFSGLTIGMFSLSPTDLQRRIKLGDKNAAKVYEIRKDGNLLLCTLLLGNVAINTAISQIMDDLTTGGVIAGLVSTGLIFIFGEVLPQAAFSKHALEIGAKTVWLVKIFRLLMYLVAKPLSLGLDFLFGKDLGDRYSKRELQAIIEEHEFEGDSPLDTDERRIIIGALQFSDKTASSVITPVNRIFKLEDNVVLNKDQLKNILDHHYSRIPVYEGDRDNVVGILYAKDLIGYESSEGKTAGEMCKRDKLMFVNENIKLDSLFNRMTKSRTHLAFVFDEHEVLQGIVSLEDIQEEILDVEILDESDTESDIDNLMKNKKVKNIITE